MGDYEISKHASRKRLAHVERVRASMAAYHNDAQAWYDAHQAVGLPGSGDASFGKVIMKLDAGPLGANVLVHWHNGTYTKLCLRERHIPQGSFIIARTEWDEPGEGVWVQERVMHVVEWISVLPPDAELRSDTYWKFSRELADLELTSLSLVAPVETHSATHPEPYPVGVSGSVTPRKSRVRSVVANLYGSSLSQQDMEESRHRAMVAAKLAKDGTGRDERHG